MPNYSDDMQIDRRSSDIAENTSASALFAIYMNSVFHNSGMISRTCVT